MVDPRNPSVSARPSLAAAANLSSNRRYRWMLPSLLVAAAAMTALLYHQVAQARWEYAEIRPLIDLAAERVLAHEQALNKTLLSQPSLPSRCRTKVVNQATWADDARVVFSIPFGDGDYARVLVRGREEADRWQLTYLEIQPTFGGWIVDGEIGGYDRIGRLQPLDLRPLRSAAQ